MGVLPEDRFEELRLGILNCDSEATKEAAEEVIKRGLPPIEAIHVLRGAMRELGEKFATQEVFLADLMLGASAMEAGLTVLLKEIPREEVVQAGVVLIGTVKGDIHDLGKNLVITMLTVAGFKVHDLGKDVPISVFAENAEKLHPDIIGASCLMTTTMPMLRELVEYFKAMGIREKYKIMVGGAPVTQEYAEVIGADGYAVDAEEAVAIAKKLVVG